MSNAAFADQIAIVTGGTRGIGRAIASAFLDAGATVIATYFGNDEAALRFQRETGNDRLHTRKFDIADYKQVEEFYRWFDDSFKFLSVLVNNGGIRRDAVTAMMNPADWQRVIDTNLTGTFAMSKFAVQAMMRNRYGRIINITSPSGRFGFAGQANYAASKAAQVAFARSLSKEVATRGITVNCVSPGYVETELLADLSPEQLKEFKAQVPMKRFGAPAEIAGAVLYLASKGASYITGATLEVTGGL